MRVFSYMDSSHFELFTLLLAALCLKLTMALFEYERALGLIPYDIARQYRDQAGNLDKL